MLGTIQIGTYSFVQGVCLGLLPNGHMQVRVGDKVYAGKPVSRAA